MSMQNIFGVTFEIMVNSAVINLLSSSNSKLPTKTFIAQQLNSTPKKLGLSNIAVEELVIKTLEEYDAQIAGVLENIIRDRDNDSLDEKVTTFTKEVVATLLRKPQLSHILSFNNLYANAEFAKCVAKINTTTYYAYKRLFNSFNEKVSHTFSRLYTDLLSGIYLNLSQNLAHGLNTNLLKDIEAEINSEITLINNLVKKIA